MSRLKSPGETGIGRALHSADAPAPGPAPVTPLPAATARPSVRPTRVSLDLVPELHAVLRDLAAQIPGSLAAADILRELLRQARDDTALAGRVVLAVQERRDAARAAQEAFKGG